MKKFKTFFYPIYLVVIVLVLLISFNIYEALELFKTWGWFKYFSDLPYMGRNLMVFLTILMAIELVAENIHLMKWRGRISGLQKEVTELKAKLYDKSQQEAQLPAFEEPTEVDEPEVEEDDDDDDF